MKMTRASLATIALLSATWSDAAVVPRNSAGFSIAVDEREAYPGGLLTVRLHSRRPLRGIVYGILDGRRCPAFPSGDGIRALVPVPVTFGPGRVTLGVEIRSSRGRERFAVPVTIAARTYAAREIVLPEAKREMAEPPAGVRDGRLLQVYLRTVSPRQEWRGPFRAPVEAVPDATFGAMETYAGVPAVASRMDSIYGEYNRGLDYDVPLGTPVKAPAAGTVLFSGPLALSGTTVVIDHGQGLVSVFSHLAQAAVREGEWIEPGRVVGASGDTGVAAVPHLHWAVYLLGVAIDPRLTERLM